MFNRNQIFGIILVIIGAIFFFETYINFNFTSFAWPFFIIIPGALFFLAVFLGGQSAAGLAIPGSIITSVGLILFIQNLTHTYESWSYAWALILAAVGFGQIIQGLRTNKHALQNAGNNTLLTGLALFAAFGFFFEFLIFRSWLNPLLSRYVFPVILIAGGIFLLIQQSFKKKELE